MSLAVAIQMDPILSVDPYADSTFVLAREAQGRGHTLFHYPPEALSLRGATVTAWAEPLVIEPSSGGHARLGASERIDLADMDVVLMRQDPPFDLRYISATHLLEHVHPQTLVVNDPVEVRNAPEKLLVMHYPDLMPPTLITNDRAEITAFREEFKDIIVKPLFGNGGMGVFHLSPGDDNQGALLDLFEQTLREPLMVQRYIPEVRQGDKRIILIDGEPAGAINRIPAEGDARANMHAGGRAARDGLTERDREICAVIGPELKARGLIFVGIDVIAGDLTEINVTSPTGLQEINRFDGVCLEARIWDAIEAHRAATRNAA